MRHVRHAVRTGDRSTLQPMELSGDSLDDEESMPVLEEGEVPWAEEPAYRCEKCKKVTFTCEYHPTLHTRRNPSFDFPLV